MSVPTAIIIVLGEAHLRRILKSYARYYNETSERTWSLDKDAPFLARFSDPVGSAHTPSWVDFITITPGFKFSVHTGSAMTISAITRLVDGRGCCAT